MPSSYVLTGRVSAIGTTAKRLVNYARPENGIEIKSHVDNEGMLYVGSSPEVTADANDTTDGFPLSPGQSVFIPARLAEKIYLVASSGATNKAFFIIT